MVATINKNEMYASISPSHWSHSHCPDTLYLVATILDSTGKPLPIIILRSDRHGRLEIRCKFGSQIPGLELLAYTNYLSCHFSSRAQI